MSDIESIKRDRHKLATWDDQRKLWKPIPLALTPVRVKLSDWISIQRAAENIASAFPKIHDWLLKPDNRLVHSKIYRGLTGLEEIAASRPAKHHWGHVTWRFDLFWDQQDLRVIEANCTIPAMQAYSDIARDLVGLVNGPSNSDQLMKCLLQAYKHRGGNSDFPTLCILHRDGDSQLAELNHYLKNWSKDVKVVLATPAELDLKDDNLYVRGEKIDLCYRHIFAWRLENQPVLSRYLSDSQNHLIFNPVSAHYESKAFLAFLSEVANDSGICQDVGLSLDTIQAVKDRVPWTRVLSRNVFVRGNSQFDFECSDLDFSKLNVDEYVVKSSIGYGGHQVIIGSDWFEPQTQIKLKSFLARNDTVTFSMFAEWAMDQSEATWIIQKRLSGRRHLTQILDADNRLIEMDTFVDASVFLSTIPEIRAHGGVSRFAGNTIVNIGTGGGLAPFSID
ncbi:MAG: hypothetical protein NT027_10745 [Proteobacteria bacterium]|nr:hypothetical protein [Pseudomonadota bacterium]